MEIKNGDSGTIQFGFRSQCFCGKVLSRIEKHGIIYPASLDHGSYLGHVCGGVPSGEGGRDMP